MTTILSFTITNLIMNFGS